MHIDHTLRIFEEVTVLLGDQLRFFATITCSNYDTFELPRETAAHKRRKSKNSQTAVLDANDTQGTSCRRKVYTMDTYKHHALGDYVETIRTYGTCDSYSTEPVCGSLFVTKHVFKHRLPSLHLG